MRASWERVIVDKAEDDEGYYFCVGTGDFIGPFVTAEDRDQDLAYEIARISRTVEATGRRLRPSSGGSWVIEAVPLDQAA